MLKSWLTNIPQLRRVSGRQPCSLGSSLIIHTLVSYAKGAFGGQRRETVNRVSKAIIVNVSLALSRVYVSLLR